MSSSKDGLLIAAQISTSFQTRMLSFTQKSIWESANPSSITRPHTWGRQNTLSARDFFVLNSTSIMYETNVMC